MLKTNAATFCQITLVFSSKAFVDAIVFHHINKFIVHNDHVYNIHLLRGEHLRFGKK